MAATVLRLLAPGLPGRFAAAAGQEPLCALSPRAQEELDALLAAVADFDALPGRWQAALLAAEAARDGAAPAPRSCCGGA